MEKEEAKFSILMFPWLAHGHIFPFLELAKKLSNRNFNIYLCTTPINIDSIKSTIIKNPSDDFSAQLLELEMPETPELPQKLHSTKNLPSNLIPNLIQAFQNSSSSFSKILTSLKPDLLIYDLFQPWAPKLALSQNIPSICFVTSGATPCSYYYHLHKFGSRSGFPSQEIYLSEQETVDIRSRIAPLIKEADHDDFAFGNFTLSSDIVLIKSCRKVEAKYFDYLSVLCNKQIVPTGPLIVHANEHEGNSEIMEWLIGKDQFSTVYISFGSEYFLSKEQIDEIAKGLELCNTNFIWIIRFPIGKNEISEENVLPEGFIERVNGKGIVVFKWAPQTSILAHKSIGAFVSHCGWSSIMESVYFGVPVIGMPMKSEQPLNARLMVEAGVGVEVGKDGNEQYLGDEVAKAIVKVIMDKATGEGLRERAESLSKKIKENEEQEMDEAAEQLMRLCTKNKQQMHDF